MLIEIYKCPHCKEEIYSRADNDFNHCKCESLAVDGGHYDKQEIWIAQNIIGEINCKTRIVEIDTNDLYLYEDWNSNKNKYGTYKEDQ